MTQQKPPAPTFNPEVPKRVVDIPGPPRRVDPPKKPEGETKRLTVGRDIILSGEITSCDVLVVEGRVEATLSNSHAIEISSTGHFKGKAEKRKEEIAKILSTFAKLGQYITLAPGYYARPIRRSA